MVFTNENTATGALLYAAEDYILVCTEKDQLQRELAILQHKHAELVGDIETGLDAHARVMEAIGN